MLAKLYNLYSGWIYFTDVSVIDFAINITPIMVMSWIVPIHIDKEAHPSGVSIRLIIAPVPKTTLIALFQIIHRKHEIFI